MAQQELDPSEIHPRFEQMRRKGVAQGVPILRSFEALRRQTDLPPVFCLVGHARVQKL